MNDLTRTLKRADSRPSAPGPAEDDGLVSAPATFERLERWLCREGLDG